MRRPRLILSLLLLLAAGCGGGSNGGSDNQSFQVNETSVAKVEAGFRRRRLTCHRLVQAYLERIAALNHGGPAINPILETNPEALAIADSLDAAFAKISVGSDHFYALPGGPWPIGQPF